jgi:hypothetical protein
MNLFKRLLKVLPLLFIHFSILEASPSNVFWTNCTTDIYETGTANINEDAFFTIFDRRGCEPFLPPDTGIEFGIFTWGDLSGEVGVDYIGGSDNPLYFNAGIGIPEDKFFCKAPALKVGIFNVGTSCSGHNKTNQNIVDLVVGKTLPDTVGGGRFFVGAYSGSRALGKTRKGFMAAYQKEFCPERDCNGKEYFKWLFCADYTSGNNAIGGGGVAFAYYFTPDISILSGPVWFNTEEYNGSWKWSIQINIDFPVFNAPKKD